MLKQGDYEMWRLRIEQYFQVQDYVLWDVIENGNSFEPVAQTTTNDAGTSTTLIPGPVTTEENAQKKNDVKALEDFWRNKHDLDAMSFDDLYNNFNIVEQESFMVDDEVPTNMALMAFSDSEVHNEKSYSKTYLKSFETIKKQYDDLRIEFNKSEFNLATYKRGLASVEEQLVFYKKNEVMFCKQIAVLKRDILYKDSKISMLKNELEKLKKEKESNQLKIENFANASKSLDKLIGSQIHDNSKKGLGYESYHVVPPLPTGLFSPPKLDLFNSGLEEFQQSEFEGYGPKTSKSVCEDISNEVKEYLDAPLVKDKVSDNKDYSVKSPVVATLDESVLWHRRLGHVIFKNINKLVKDNLVTSLPTKRFENDQTCVACLKGKQHKASCKSKVHNFISQPLFMLHMDSFGPTFVSSLMHKKYGLVVTDDYRRNTWVFFLVSKDETTCILKKLIIEIENLVDKKIKVIICDNRTKFKNSVMNDFCAMQGIRREFSVARTLQQNGVAEKKNKTLNETARTMLADSKFPTTFWVEAVNIVCYVQNKVLVVKPQNKILYELFRGRTPALSFIRPFGCHVTILNTLDHLGKFDGKSDDGFFVGYSLNSNRPKWLFDIDVLTKSMNYVPVVAGTNSNDFNASNDKPQLSSDAEKKNDDGVSKESGINDPDVNTTGSNINTISTNVNTDSLNINTVSLLVTTAPPEATHTDFFGDDTEVDTSNISNTYLVPSTPNTRIYKDHSLDHVIGDVQSGVQTRRMTKTINEQGFISDVYKGKDHEDLHAYLFTCFLSQEEPKKMDVKSAFLYGNIEEEVYVCQPLGFEDPEFPDKVYKVEKALYGLHQAPRVWYETLSTYLLDNGFQRDQIDKTLFIKRFKGLQVKQKNDRIFINQDKYVDEILKKFGFSTVKTASTLIETSKPLLKDAEVKDVDVNLYRSMIGSLMFLTSSRPDIMFVDSPFDLEAYTGSDYAGVSLNGKSTTGGCQFLRSRLISWQCKKKNVIANSTSEADTMASAIICLATNQKFNFSKYIFDHMVKNLEDGVKLFMFPRFVQVFLDSQVKGMLKHKEIYVTPSHTKKIFAKMKRQGKDFFGKVTPLFETTMVQPQEDMGEDLEIPTDSHHIPTVTQPSTSSQPRQKHKSKKSKKRITEVPQLSYSTHDVADEHETTTFNDPLLSEANQAFEIESLKRRVKKIEKKASKKTHKLKRLYKIGSSTKVESFEDAGLGDQEDASKQRRVIDDLDANEGIVFVNETQGRNDQDMFDTSILDNEEVVAEKEVSTADPVPTVGEVVTTASVEVSTAAITSQIYMDEITLAKALINIKTSKPKANGIVMQEPKLVKGSKKAIEGSYRRAESKLEQKDAKRQRIEEENESGELKRCLKIIPDNEDDVTIKATPLSSKSLTIVDYKIYKEGRKSFFKIIRAYGGRLVKAMYLNEVFGYILLIKIKLLIKKLKDSEATKKTQKTLLKQMYENFSIPNTESLDSIFNRLENNNTHVRVWRNKPDLDTMSFDDLYNNFKIVEQEVKGTANSSSNSENMAFVSSPRSTNKVNTAYGVSTANTQANPSSTQVNTASTQVSTANLSNVTVYAIFTSQPNVSQLAHEDLVQIHKDDLVKMDLKWQLALLSMRTKRVFQKTGRKITINGNDYRPTPNLLKIYAYSG
nr:hypothetical protein [Tanacetum cinerariifolium]